MKPSEAAVVIGRLSAVDNRTESEAAAVAWAEALDQRTSLTDALDAVRRHQAESTEWCTPAHINAITRKIRHDRTQAAGTPPIPAGLTYDQEQTWRKTWAQAIGDGKGADWAPIIADQAVQSQGPKQIEGDAA